MFHIFYMKHMVGRDSPLPPPLAWLNDGCTTSYGCLIAKPCGERFFNLVSREVLARPLLVVDALKTTLAGYAADGNTYDMITFQSPHQQRYKGEPTHASI